MQTDNTAEYSRRWSQIKSSLRRRQRPVFFKEGEMWWCSIGMNIGQEIFGKGDWFIRPVLVLKKLTNRLFLGLPLTTKDKRGNWHVEIVHRGKRRVAILSQARALDSRRLLRPMGTLSDSALQQVASAFAQFYGPK